LRRVCAHTCVVGCVRVRVRDGADFDAADAAEAGDVVCLHDLSITFSADGAWRLVYFHAGDHTRTHTHTHTYTHTQHTHTHTRTHTHTQRVVAVDLSSTRARADEGGETVTLPATGVSWNSTGSALAASFGEVEHAGWCGHRAGVAVWNVFRRDFAPPHKPDVVLESAVSGRGRGGRLRARGGLFLQSEA
jgi:hypothetical protein